MKKIPLKTILCCFLIVPALVLVAVSYVLEAILFACHTLTRVCLFLAKYCRRALLSFANQLEK